MLPRKVMIPDFIIPFFKISGNVKFGRTNLITLIPNYDIGEILFTIPS